MGARAALFTLLKFMFSRNLYPGIGAGRVIGVLSFECTMLRVYNSRIIWIFLATGVQGLRPRPPAHGERPAPGRPQVAAAPCHHGQSLPFGRCVADAGIGTTFIFCSFWTRFSHISLVLSIFKHIFATTKLLFRDIPIYFLSEVSLLKQKIPHC